MPLDSGARLGPYEIASPLGSGGMGDVYRARDSRLDRTVAIKVVRGEFTERFEREAKAISALNHPHICTLHDVGSEGGVHYLVMELVEGESLSDRLRKGALPQAQAIRIAREIAEALDAAHRKGIAHRDLKRGNIMLTKTGVKLLDFGLAKVAAVPTPASDLQSLRVEPRFRAVVAKCPFVSFEEIAYDRVYRYGGLNRPAARPLVRTAFFYARLIHGLDLDQASPAAMVRSTTVPVLLIHGTADTNIPPRHSRELHALNPRATELREVPGATHVTALAAQPQTYEEKVVAWFSR